MYRQGDPGFLSNLWGAVKGAVTGFVTGGPAGAVVGAVGGYIGASQSGGGGGAPRPVVTSSGEVYGPTHLPGGQPTSSYPYSAGSLGGGYPGGYGSGAGYGQQPWTPGTGYGNATVAGGPWGNYPSPGSGVHRGRARRRRRVCYYE